MEAAPGRLHNSGAGAFGARPTVVDSIILDGEAANMAIPTHTRSDTYLIKATFFLIVQICRKPFGKTPF